MERPLKHSFTRPLANQVGLQVRHPYSFPSVPDAWCPKLDIVAKQLLGKEAKEADTPLARLQVFILDTLAPMLEIAEEAQKGSLKVEKAGEAARAAIALLGNASCQVVKER